LISFSKYILVKLLPKTTKPMGPNTHTQNTREKNACNPNRKFLETIIKRMMKISHI
jgi:hypothetical protein